MFILFSIVGALALVGIIFVFGMIAGYNQAEKDKER